MAQQRNLFSFFKKGQETPSKGSFASSSLQGIDGKKQGEVKSEDFIAGGTRYAEEKNRANSGSPSSRQDRFFAYDNGFL
jgi:hypothetical protein